VNDGSTDNSGDILEAYKQQHPELIILNKPNGGLSSARNAGLEVAKGEYIYFLDSDDYLYEGVLSKMLDFVLQNKLEVGCFNVLKDGKVPYFEISIDSLQYLFIKKYKIEYLVLSPKAVLPSVFICSVDTIFSDKKSGDRFVFLKSK
jgi:glycosyltransferase involved in cell wall biosynthesis